MVPGWVRPAHSDVRGAHVAAWQLYAASASLTHAGTFAALNWVTGRQAAPVSERTEPVSWELVRAEAWLALCCAAEMDPPVARDWSPRGGTPRGGCPRLAMVLRRVVGIGLAAGHSR